MSSRLIISIVAILSTLSILFYSCFNNVVQPKEQQRCTTASATNEFQIGLSSIPKPEPNRCVTSEERYRQCIDLRVTTQMDKHKLRDFFSELQFYSNDLKSTRKRSQREVALLRMHKKVWSREFWLFVCSFVIEASAVDRDVVLYTLDGHEHSIPFEFTDFVRVHLETELERIFLTLPYKGGYQRGDLAASLFLKANPQYGFVWMIESDVRYTGNWNQLFVDSRRAAMNANDDVPTEGEGAKIGKPAHLIWWHPRLLNYGYDHPWGESLWEGPFRNDTTKWRKNEQANWNAARHNLPVPKDPTTIKNTHGFSIRRYFFRDWQHILQNKTWCSALLVAFGMSKELAKKVYEVSLAGQGNWNQEVVVPVTAQLFNMKIVTLARFKEFPTQNYFPGHTNRISYKNETAPLYEKWFTKKDSEVFEERDVVTGKYTLFTDQFLGKKCLMNVLFHPVKY